MAVSPPPIRTLADLQDRLGQIPLERIRFQPALGTASEHDLLEVAAREGVACELAAGVLVEKSAGYRESVLAMCIAHALLNFVRPRNLGHVSGEQGPLRLHPGLVRVPDVAFVSWERLPEGRLPRKSIPSLAPDLVVEVSSPSNTRRELAIKLEEYFSAGVRRVWIVDPDVRTVWDFSGPTSSVALGEQDVLEGGDMLPGFALSLQELLAELDRQA